LLESLGFPAFFWDFGELCFGGCPLGAHLSKINGCFLGFAMMAPIALLAGDEPPKGITGIAFSRNDQCAIQLALPYCSVKGRVDGVEWEGP
jgi:hypothetical protein